MNSSPRPEDKVRTCGVPGTQVAWEPALPWAPELLS